MATLAVRSGAVTLLDIAKTFGPDGKPLIMAELLSQSNEILADMTWIEGNLPTGHRGGIRTGLPAVVWHKMYKGTPPSKSLRATVDDACGILKAMSEVDIEVANLNGNTAAFRASEATAFVEAMNQEMARAMVYGDASVNPEQFNGLAIRYNTINSATSEIAKNVVSGGGTGNCTSVWLVCWGPNTVTGIYPKGSMAGLDHTDKGMQLSAPDADNNRFDAYVDIFRWSCGLHVKDWRYVVRIANIGMTDLLAQTGTQALTASTALAKLMVRAMGRIPNKGMGKSVFYASRTVKQMLCIAALDRSQNALAIQPALQQFGSVEPGYLAADLTFLGVPVRTVDAILENETPLV